jgi:hypothetical protein
MFYSGFHDLCHILPYSNYNLDNAVDNVNNAVNRLQNYKSNITKGTYDKTNIKLNVPCRFRNSNKKSGLDEQRLKLFLKPTEVVKNQYLVMNVETQEVYQVEIIKKPHDKRKAHHITLYLKHQPNLFEEFDGI